MAEFEIEGALLIELPGPSLKRVKFMFSDEKKRLAVISVAKDFSHRVEVLERRTDPQWSIPVWSGVDCQSITDTFESAEKIAEEKLKDSYGR